MVVRKDLVKYKAHNVAVHHGLNTGEFVSAMLRARDEHKLYSLEDIDTEGRIWASRLNTA